MDTAPNLRLRDYSKLSSKSIEKLYLILVISSILCYHKKAFDIKKNYNIKEEQEE